MVNAITSGELLRPDQYNHHFKVFAGPGAGKTHFLVENVKNIIQTDEVISKSKLRKVLCITYTNAAVDEITHRLDRYTEYVETHTIHGFIIEHIIKLFQDDLIEIMKSDFDIDVPAGQIISSQLEGLGILHGIDKEDIFQYICRENQEDYQEGKIKYSKKIMGDVQVDNKSFTCEHPENTTIKYSKQIKDNHVKPLKRYIWSVVRMLTHDEILYFGYRILQKNPTALYSIRVKFPFVFVDEFQDTSPIQTQIIKLIGEKSTKIGVVGDVAQSIYSFQGAHPSDFLSFKINEETDVEYSISNNRRSTESIVNFCDFLRKSDHTVVQNNVRDVAEQNPIKFLIGNSNTVKEAVGQAIADGAVVLTRTWAAAFDYIQNIDPEQSELLKTIYNSYNYTPISIRDEISEHNNVTWVRAFRFIFTLWRGYNSGSLVDVFSAIKLYTKIDKNKVQPKHIFLLDKMLKKAFEGFDENTSTVSIIEKLNSEMKTDDYSNVKQIFTNDFSEIPIFDDMERDKLKQAVSELNWYTSSKLFSEVFSEDSIYMTVHQSKGLEWDKVIVAVVPNTREGITMTELFSNPHLTEETKADEFVRMYYVACSRAKNDLIIHIPKGCGKDTIDKSLKEYISNTGRNIQYEFLS